MLVAALLLAGRYVHGWAGVKEAHWLEHEA